MEKAYYAKLGQEAREIDNWLKTVAEQQKDKPVGYSYNNKMPESCGNI